MTNEHTHTVAANYPAFTVLERAPVNGEVELFAGESLTDDKHLSEYKANSVATYAKQYNEDPDAAVARAKANGHTLHWINAMGASLTAWERPKETRVLIRDGMAVRFEGLSFVVRKAPNGNYKFSKA